MKYKLLLEIEEGDDEWWEKVTGYSLDRQYKMVVRWVDQILYDNMVEDSFVVKRADDLPSGYQFELDLK